MSKKNDVVTGIEAGQAFGTAVWVVAFFSFGVFFLALSAFSGFDPQRAIAGCALVYTAKAIGE